jgi:hypothetical protein
MPSFQAPPAWSTAAFVLLCLAVVLGFAGAVWQSERPAGLSRFQRLGPVGIGLLAGLGLFSWVAASGWIQAHPMPGLPFLLATVLAVSLGLGFSPVGTWLSESTPIPLLVAFQGFRLPLELLLHVWAERGTIPPAMTWTGSNWDIVSGIAALLLAYPAKHSRAAAWAANLIGAALLVNVVRVVVLSSPLPFAWQADPPLQLAFHLPYAWILPVCVGGAAACHVILTRALLRHPAPHPPAKENAS